MKIISPVSILFFLLILFSTIAKAQPKKEVPGKYLVEHFGEEQGLMQNSIKKLMLDEYGFLWAATSAGIVKFDGNKFLKVTSSPHLEMSGLTSVASMYKKGKDTIMIYSLLSRKVALVVKNKIITIENQQLEKQGLLFLNMDFTVPSPAFIKGTINDPSAAGIENWAMTRFGFMGSVCNKDTFWVVLNDGVGFYNNTGIINKIKIDNVDASSVFFINGQIVYVDKDNYINFYSILTGFQKRVLLDVDNSTQLRFLFSNVANTFYCVSGKLLFQIGITDSGQIYKRLIISDLQSADNITCVYEIDKNTIAIGTRQNGLYIYKQSFFSATDPLLHGELDEFYAQHLLNDKQTILTGKGLLFRNGKHTGKRIASFKSELFGYFIKSKKGDFWYLLDKTIQRTKDIEGKPDTIFRHKDEVLYIFCEDRQGRVWISTTTEFGYYENNSFRKLKVKNINAWQITSIRQDSKGQYYIGTEQGLFILANINDNYAQQVKGFESVFVRYILHQDDGLTWVCSYGNGLFLISNGVVTSFPDNGSRLNYVHTLLEDSSGCFWLSANSGLFVTTKKSLLDYSKDKSKRPFFYRFSTKNGFRTNEFNGGVEPPYLVLPNDDISFPSMKGLVQFSPSKIKFGFSSSPIIVQDIYLDSVDVSETGVIEVGNKVENISFSIYTSYWGEPDNYIIQYQVIKKGAHADEKNWIPVEVSGKINLFSPSYGHYQLIVRKRTGFNSSDYVYKAVDFYIRPKWFQTTIFFICSAIAIAGILTGIFFWRRRYYRRANQVLKEKVNAATIELQQMNNTLEKKVKERTLAIQEAEKKFRTLVERSLVGVYIIQDQKYFYVNPRYEEILGYSTGELQGKEAFQIIKEDSRHIAFEKISHRLSGEADSHHYEITGIQKDGTERQLEFFGSRTVYEGKPTIIGTMVDITEKKLLEKEIQEQNDQEQKIMFRSILLGEERERNKIGQELHDNINQILAGAKMYLGMAKKGNPGDDNIITESIGLIDHAINEIRILTKEKVTPVRKADLNELLQSLLGRFSETSAIETSLVYNEEPDAIEDDLKLNIYRIIQEQLNNILKYAKAKNVNVIIDASEKNIHVVVADDGVGFDVTIKKKGIGIANMINRVESFHGTVDIESSAGNGCRIEINLPSSVNSTTS